ncbi:ChaN family lipoprotein [Marinobacter sp. M1N3S26]|uniref:ChaN family lipoprotein n=1 Tax=Marinobacter sp. M1N3S26 TaxID=3382299 RepID=UPI00387B22DE
MSLPFPLTKLSSIAAAAFLAGCAVHHSPPDTPPATFYDTRLADASGQPLTIPGLASRLDHADVVVIGELHGHQGAHLLEARLQAALYHRNPDQILALEAFNLDHQAHLDQYLAGKLGEEEMMEDAAAWENYQASYRPLVEFARRHDLPVVAANAPSGVVRCVGREGASYLDTLPETERDALPEQPFPEVPGYRERFMDTLGHSGHGESTEEGKRRLDNTYQAQLLRDSTMADRILEALATHPDHQVLMITGTFHSKERQGLVAVLEQRAPELDIRVITPYMPVDDGSLEPPPAIAAGDFRYDLWPLPVRYRDGEREQAAMMERFGRARELTCD